MPAPGFVGALAATLSSGRPANPPTQEQLEAWEYQKTKRILAENLKSTIQIHLDLIPARFGKVRGTLTLEAQKEISHDGIFMMVKGISMSERHLQKIRLAGKKITPALKFQILSPQSNYYVLESGMQIYPVELSVRVRKGKYIEDLPVPIITPEGKLVFRFQAYLTLEGKHFLVAEIKVPYENHYNVFEHSETEKAVRIETQLNYKKGYLSRRHVASVSLTCEPSGYLPGEIIHFFIETQNPGRVPLNLKVELLKKLWYQEPTRRQRDPLSKKLSVEMKEILVAAEEKAGGTGEKEIEWKGALKLPSVLTPSYKYDFFNSISYNIRLTVEVEGDKPNGKVIGESPIYIGNKRENEEEEEEEECDKDVERGNADSNAGSNCSGIDNLVGTGFPTTSRSMNCIYNEAYMIGAMRQRAGSIASIESTASSTPSMFRLPPSYSQLSSRRPTLETLPPEYCELELQEEQSEIEENIQECDNGENKEAE